MAEKSGRRLVGASMRRPCRCTLSVNSAIPGLRLDEHSQSHRAGPLLDSPVDEVVRHGSGESTPAPLTKWTKTKRCFSPPVLKRVSSCFPDTPALPVQWLITHKDRIKALLEPHNAPDNALNRGYALPFIIQRLVVGERSKYKSCTGAGHANAKRRPARRLDPFCFS